jgi:hypothetical protein
MRFALREGFRGARIASLRDPIGRDFGISQVGSHSLGTAQLSAQRGFEPLTHALLCGNKSDYSEIACEIWYHVCV